MLDPEDRFEDHVADTLTAGGALWKVDAQSGEVVWRVATAGRFGLRFIQNESASRPLPRSRMASFFASASRFSIA